MTMCAYNRECLFGEIEDAKLCFNDFGRIAELFWQEIPPRYPDAKLDSFIIMPNHIHVVIIIEQNNVGAIHELPLHNKMPQRNRRNMLLTKIIGYFKMNTAKRINQLRHTYGVPVWQRNYYEHVIRGKNDLNRIREYISNNLAKWEEDKYYIKDGACL